MNARARNLSQNKQISVPEVLIYKYPDGEKAYTTTVMNKLKNRGFLTSEKIGLVEWSYSQLQLMKREM